jgi:hypothetical protein
VITDTELGPDGQLHDVERTNCTGLAHLVLRPELRTPRRLRGHSNWDGDPLRSIQRINERLRETVSSYGIVSSESFSFARTDDEQERLAAMFAGFRLVPIGYFRDHDAWAECWRAARKNELAKRCRDW